MMYEKESKCSKEYSKEYSGFKTSIETAMIEERIKGLRIDMRDKRRDIDVIMKPMEYLKHIKNIREELRRTVN